MEEDSITRCGPDGETGPHHESRATGFRTLAAEGLARFGRDVEKPVAKPDYAGHSRGNMTRRRSRRASEPTHTGRTDGICTRGRDQVHGRAGTMFVCVAPPLERGPEHRVDRLTPTRPQRGKAPRIWCVC